MYEHTDFLNCHHHFYYSLNGHDPTLSLSSLHSINTRFFCTLHHHAPSTPFIFSMFSTFIFLTFYITAFIKVRVSAILNTNYFSKYVIKDNQIIVHQRRCEFHKLIHIITHHRTLPQHVFVWGTNCVLLKNISFPHAPQF